MRKKLRILEVAHVKVPGVVQDLRTYLLRNFSDVTYIEHPFSTIRELGKSTASSLEEYRNGKMIRRHRSHEPAGGELFYWLRDVLWTLWMVPRLERHDVGIGLDCLNAATLLLLKLIGRVSYVVYYTVDVTDKRFPSQLLSRLYIALDRFCCRYADEVWDVSSAVATVRKRYGYHALIKHNSIVPIGVYPEEYGSARRGKRTPGTIVYLGSLFRIMGIQLAIEAMPLVRKRIPAARLIIVGKGDYEPQLRELVARLRLQTVVQFEYYPTRLQNIARLYTGVIGVAPYTYDEESYKFYCDPTKVKEYAAAGLPMVITDVPDVSRVIAETPLGLTVKYDRKAFAAAAVRLLRDKPLYDRCRRNCATYIRQYSWNRIFAAAFTTIHQTFP